MTTTPTKATDLVCGMNVDPSTAAASVEHEGQMYYFCSHGCHKSFVKDPAAYVPAGHDHSAHDHHSH